MRSFDAHVHCSMKNPVERSIEYYKQICEWNETEKMAILSIPHSFAPSISNFRSPIIMQSSAPHSIA